MVANYCISSITYNLSNEYDAESMLHTDFDKISLLGVLPCIIAFGILSNFVFLFTVFRLKRMQTVTNYYLSALAMCDVSLLAAGSYGTVLAFARSVGRLFALSALRTRYHCSVAFAFAALFYYTSLSLVSLVSTERFYALCYPLRHKVITGKRRTVKLILGALGISLVFAVVNSTSLARVESFCVIWPNSTKFSDMPTTGTQCTPLNNTIYIFHEVFNMTLFFTLFIYNTVLYLKIVYALSKRSLVTKSSDDLQANRVRNQVARVLILNGLVFFTCQGPYRYE